MATAITTLSPQEKDERVTTLAALLLHDAGAEISAEKINEVITASGNSVAKYWPGLFASLLKKTDVGKLIERTSAPGSGGGAAAPAAAAPAAKGGKEEKEAPKAKEEKKKEEEPADVGGGDLFGGGGGGKY